MINYQLFQRTELLLGDDAINKINSQKVIIFGIGGVGSWCAESLIRSGINDLTIVDSDKICISNINRQIMATTKTIGEIKVEALKNRLLEINPQANITALQMVFNKDTKDCFGLEKYDYIIDSIDSLSNKILLILEATKTNSKFFSSMGAALKLDFTKIKVTEFWKIEGCPLAAIIRKKMRHRKTFPSKKFQCVFSPEVLENKGNNNSNYNSSPQEEWSCQKAQVNGTIVHTTAIFGFVLAGMIINDIVKSLNNFH